MFTKSRIVAYGLFLLLFHSGELRGFGGQQVIPEELLTLVLNEVSGERAWDMVSKISRYHRIRGGGEGSDYNRCVDWLAGELKQHCRGVVFVPLGWEEKLPALAGML